MGGGGVRKIFKRIERGENIQIVRDLAAEAARDAREATKTVAKAPTKVVKEVAKAGSDIATIPPKVFHELYKHDLTDKGLKIFLEDWNKTNQKIS